MEIARFDAGGAMLKGALVFLVVGLVAALLGFTTIAGASFAIAKIFAAIFLFMFLMMLVLALFATRAV
jgi:uncharacterized membrane protein YtjA (UPF0391 family)